MKFKLEENAGINPSVVANLKSIPIGGFSYQHYKLRHPGAIYNLMTSKLVDSISILCNEISQRKVENLKSSFRLVIHDFFQFYESCYEIILCFCKPHVLPKDHDVLHKWLKINHYSVGETFYNSTKNEIKVLKYCHNEIKHSSNDIQFITFKNRQEITPAYFLDMPKEAYKSPLDPVSLNRELKRIYFLIYHISEKLKETLVSHLKAIYHFDLVPSPDGIKDESFCKLRKSIDLLSDFYLLNEIDKSVYKSSINGGVINFSQLVITESLVDEYYSNGMNLEMTVTHDGYNLNVFVPFCGLEQIGSKFYYKSKSGNLIELKVTK